MKRVIAVLVLLVLTISLVACVKTEEYPLEGEWKIPVNDLGIFSTAYPESVYTVLEFKADNSIHAINVGLGVAPYPDDFTYVVNGNALTITGEDGKVEECIYEIKGDVLTIETEELTLEFMRVTD